MVLIVCPILYILINFFKTLIQSFYIALSRNSIREPRRKGAVGVRQAAAVIIIRAGGAAKKKLSFFEKISQSRKLCRKDPIPNLNTCITYLNT